MSTFWKVVIAWVGLLCVGQLVLAMMLAGTSSWLIILAVFAVGIATYHCLFKRLGIVVIGIAGVAVAIQLISLVLSGVCWVWAKLGWFQIIVGVGAVFLTVFLATRGRH